MALRKSRRKTLMMRLQTADASKIRSIEKLVERFRLFEGPGRLKLTRCEKSYGLVVNQLKPSAVIKGGTKRLKLL